MPKSFGTSDADIEKYAVETFRPLDPTLEAVLALARAAGLPEIQVGPMDGLLLEILARGFAAQKIVEVGTLGGFSGVCLARALGPHGRLYTLDISAENAAVARRAFETAGVLDKVEIIVGPAVETLKTLSSEGPFDLVFIDADKVGYPEYLVWAAENLRVGGAVLADNTFAWGLIANENAGPSSDSTSVQHLRKFNATIAEHPSFRSTILPTGEGLTLGVKIR